MNINIHGMHDQEARGSRLLDRARLSREHQRMILVAAGHQLDFDIIRDAMRMMFPD